MLMDYADPYLYDFFVLQLCTLFQVRRPFVSVLALVDLVTLIFDLLTSNLMRIIARGVGNLLTIFDVSRMFRFRLIGHTCQAHQVILRP